jgi:TatD DNase family protein
MNNYIVDSHCHLDLIEEKGLKLDEILENCSANNVKILQTICTRVTEADALLDYTKNHDFIYASYGIHPCNVTEQPKITAAEIVKFCNSHEKIIGIGETGLDYYHDRSAIPLQKELFLEHIEASRQTKLPLIIHSRDCDLDMMEILTSEQKNGEFPALLHCFSSTDDLAKKALDLGLYISISGIVTFKNATVLQEIVKSLPLSALLVETDSPYLAPTPFRGKTNQPAFTKHVVEFIAELKGLTVAEVTHQTTQNFLDIFTKAKAL